MPENNEQVPNEEIAALLLTVTKEFEKEDRSTRERQLRHYRKLKLYWNNMNRIYWSETARDYRIASNLDTQGEDLQQAYYDRPVNVFRAFLETIIAALSVQVPAVNCVPGDADNPLDLSTAKAGNIISEQIYKHNDVIELWLNALYVYMTEGLIGCYSYAKSDEKYGTYEDKKFEDRSEEAYVCPNCKMQMGDELFSNRVEDSFAPDDADVLILDALEEGPVCLQCGELLDPNIQKEPVLIPRLIGSTTKPKSRICLEVYGGLYIKVANYAKKQSDTPYLIQTYDTHYSNAIEAHEHLRDKLKVAGSNNAGGISGYDAYDSTYRQNVEYGGETPEGNVTVRNAWLRPSAFNVLNEDKCNELKELFPSGVRVTFVNEHCAHYCNESLDDCWTLSKNPTSDYLTHEPMGELLTNVQDIVNDLISLTLQTIEHGVQQTWADPAVVDFEGQKQVEANPGMITAIKANPGGNISDAFFASTAAKLAPEVFSFYKIIFELGQFTSGAMPSLYGGAQANKTSRTAAEYSMQQSTARQRLQTPWRMLTIWWKQIFGKAIPAYMKLIVETETVVKKAESGNYVNTFITKAEIGGRIGDIELESSDTLPITDEQKSDILMRLMELNNMEVMEALTIPENLPFVRKVIKIPEFKLPGEADRQKQLEEINLMLNGEFIEIDPIIDNSQVEWDITRGWLISEEGRLAKTMNPQGYQFVLMHGQMHFQVVQQAAMAQMAAETGPESKGPKQLPEGKGASE